MPDFNYREQSCSWERRLQSAVTTKVVTPDRRVDAFGLLCPAPLIKTAQAIKEMERGQILELLSTDPGAKSDLRTWCQANGHDYLDEAQEGRIIKIWIRKGIKL
ncbi:MAG: sulfurtransferase TusA family protein [Calditrichota bacterium]